MKGSTIMNRDNLTDLSTALLKVIIRDEMRNNRIIRRGAELDNDIPFDMFNYKDSLDSVNSALNRVEEECPDVTFEHALVIVDRAQKESGTVKSILKEDYEIFDGRKDLSRTDIKFGLIYEAAWRVIGELDGSVDARTGSSSTQIAEIKAKNIFIHQRALERVRNISTRYIVSRSKNIEAGCEMILAGQEELYEQISVGSVVHATNKICKGQELLNCGMQDMLNHEFNEKPDWREDVIINPVEEQMIESGAELLYGLFTLIEEIDLETISRVQRKVLEFRKLHEDDSFFSNRETGEFNRKLAVVSPKICEALYDYISMFSKLKHKILRCSSKDIFDISSKATAVLNCFDRLGLLEDVSAPAYLLLIGTKYEGLFRVGSDLSLINTAISKWQPMMERFCRTMDSIVSRSKQSATGGLGGLYADNKDWMQGDATLSRELNENRFNYYGSEEEVMDELLAHNKEERHDGEL